MEEQKDLAEEHDLIIRLKLHDIKAIKSLIFHHDEQLRILAYVLIKDQNLAPLIVDELWTDMIAGELNNEITTPLYSFLTNKIRERCELFLKSNKN